MTSPVNMGSDGQKGAGHTPGPWHYEYTRIGHTVRQSSNDSRALMVVNVSESPEADGRLIAAAPELVEALRTVLDGDSEGRFQFMTAGNPHAADAFWDSLRALLAKLDQPS